MTLRWLLYMQAERTSQGMQLMERLRMLWAVVSPADAAEGRAGVEAIMAGTDSVHSSSLTKVGVTTGRYPLRLLMTTTG